MNSVEESRLIAQVVDRLARKHSGIPDHLVAEAVTRAQARFVGSRIRDYVPLLVERIAYRSLSNLVEGNR